jgi:hypothetical protein
MILNYKKPQPLNLDSVVFVPIRKCRKCAEIKPYSEFRKEKNRKFGIRHICKECNNIRIKKLREKNPEKVREHEKKWREKNPEKVKEKNKRWMKKNPEKAKEKNKIWREKNPEKRNLINRRYLNKNLNQIMERRKKRMDKNPEYKLRILMSYRLSKMFKQKKLAKNSKTLEILGTSFNNFKCYLESQFNDGMTWENHGKVWQIDHKVPVSYGKNEEEICKLNHYTNLQPLFTLENQKKSDKLLPEHEELYKKLLNREL